MMDIIQEEKDGDMLTGTDRDDLADLKRLCQKGFHDDPAAAALALGRDEELVIDMIAGNTPVDEDLAMKVHGIAEERGINLD